MTLIGLLFIVFYFIIFIYTIDKISRGKIEYIIIYICTCLPIYTTLQAQVFKIFDSEVIVTIIKLSKDIIFIYAFMIFIFGTNIHLFKRSFKFSLVDKLIMFFTFLVTIYALIPLGEADLISKLIYAKNLYIISINAEKEQYPLILVDGKRAPRLSPLSFHINNVTDSGCMNCHSSNQKFSLDSKEYESKKIHYGR